MTVSDQQDVCLVRNSLSDVDDLASSLLALNYSLAEQITSSVYKPRSELTMKQTSHKLALNLLALKLSWRFFEDHHWI